MNQPMFIQKENEINPGESIRQLEAGQVLFFPDHFFVSIDESLFTSAILDGKHKNVSFDRKKNKLGGYSNKNKALEDKLFKLMHAYSEFSFELIQKALPDYVPYLQWGRTSFRPAEIKGRVSSKCKDDTRLHVDSFAASPVNGLRILRVFCNVNPDQEPRVWNLGEPFPEVLKQFAPKITPYSGVKASLLKWIKATKTLRSAYDHYMLQLHDRMKCDDGYQAQVQKTQIDFPSQSTWIVFTDQVSHAALSGQYLLEQTFYLPVKHMAYPEHSPWNQLKQLEFSL